MNFLGLFKKLVKILVKFVAQYSAMTFERVIFYLIFLFMIVLANFYIFVSYLSYYNYYKYCIPFIYVVNYNINVYFSINILHFF